jgi:HlyD family secretion protein
LRASRKAVMRRLVAAGLAALGIAAHAQNEPAAVGGTGRIQPAGGVLLLAGPPAQSVERVAVREGDTVKKGALLLTLSEEPVRAAERELALERLRGLEAQSAERRKMAELEVQAAELALAQAADEAASLAGLDERTVPARERKQRERDVAQAQIALALARAKSQEARRTAETEIAAARVSLKLAEAALAATRVVAPIEATVIEVHVQPGAKAGPGPALTLADTSRMYVVADFFEADLPRLAVGQRARVSNAALGAPLGAAVERIGRVIDPVNRLGRVWLRLDKPSPADRFIGMQVDARVEVGRPKPR